MPKGCAADLFTSKNQKLFSKKRSIQRSIAVIENRQIRNRKSCLHITQFENTRCSDTHITILPEFVMPAGREAEFKAGFSKFYDATKVDFPMRTKFSGFNEFSKIYLLHMSPKGFVILHILHAHLSRIVHSCNLLFTLL